VGAQTDGPEWRNWRWVEHLPDGRIAYRAGDEAGWTRLSAEAELLRRLRPRVSFAVPEVVATDQGNRRQVRRKTAGANGFWIEELVCGLPGHVPYAARLRPDFPITVAGRRLAGDLGRAIAELQRALSPAEAAGLGLAETTYLPDIDEIHACLEDDATLADLRPAAHLTRVWFQALPADPVFTHGDLYAPNLAVDETTGALAGIFDFDQAAIAHRLDEFKYLPGFGLPFMMVLLEAYEAHGGRTIGMSDLWCIHAYAALEHLTRVARGTLRWSRVVEWSRAVAARLE
jgi:Phosphotransferase enzyme family